MFERGRVQTIHLEVEYPDGSHKALDIESPSDVGMIAFDERWIPEEHLGEFNVSESDWQQNPAILVYRKQEQGGGVAAPPPPSALCTYCKPKPEPMCRRCAVPPHATRSPSVPHPRPDRRSPATRRPRGSQASPTPDWDREEGAIVGDHRPPVLIDCEEDRTLRAVLVGMLRKYGSR